MKGGKGHYYMKHSVAFKQSVVKKYLSRGNRSVNEILEEVGISSPTLYQWRDQFANVATMKKQTKPHSRTTNEKIKSIVEYDSLSIEKRGEYLRRNGLHEEHISEWRKQIDEALSDKKPKKDQKELLAEKEIKTLKKELRHKEKALAEASALLILKKKADLIWGMDEEDE